MESEVHALTHLHDDVEAAAYRDLYASAPRDLASRLGLETRVIAGATLLIAPGIPTPMFNRVIGLGNTRDVSAAELEEITAVYRDAGTGNWWIHVAPGIRSTPLSEQLTAHGFTSPPRKSWVKVVRGSEALPKVETDAEVRLVLPGEETAFAETLCVAFEMPVAWAPLFASLTSRRNWRAGVAVLDGKVIGGGLVHLQGSHAWLGAGGVRPEARRHHAHRAVMVLRMQEATRSGCTRFFTETGEPVGDEPNPSLRNMEACGFTRVCLRRNYAAPTS